jgi:hypothetical protein
LQSFTVFFLPGAEDYWLMEQKESQLKKNHEFAQKHHIFMKWAWAIIGNQAAACRLQGEAWKHIENKKQ